MHDDRLLKWKRLDNAAKIFPATSNTNDSRVFRFSCELYEPVNCELLQQAVDSTFEQFPFFSSVIRKGLFWYYLEYSDLKPVVCKEYKPPCSNLYIHDKRNLLFDVTYYNKRINLEIFHALTDGTGAMQFLRQIVFNYLMLKHKELNMMGITLDYAASIEEKEADSFEKHYNQNVKTKKKPSIKRAYNIKSHKSDNINIIEAVVSTKQMLTLCRSYDTTISIFITAVFLCAIHDEMSKRQERKRIAIMVPVNLRKFFKSESVRNFFSWIDVDYSFNEDDSFETVLNSVKDYFKQELVPKKMSMKISNFMTLETNPFLRIVPLSLKNIALIIGAKISSLTRTAVYSNMGNITMPPETVPYIKMFNVIISTPKIELCMCSFEDKLALSFSTYYESKSIQRNFFRRLQEFDLNPVIAAN